jgi:uncharacterized surface protein with fasciclin (FAS1) repeats
MKKVLYACLTLTVLSGLGVGFWFLRSDSTENDATQIVEEETADYTQKNVAEAYAEVGSTKHLAEFATQSDSLTKTATAEQVVLFAPTTTALDTFTKETALGFLKFVDYHVVTGSADAMVPEIKDGARLMTEAGQELVIVVQDGNLYVRDAKGNDARLRKPIEAKNGKIYVIDKVLLTQ